MSFPNYPDKHKLVSLLNAEDLVGNISSPSNQASATVAQDTFAPVVNVTSPGSFATVTGTVTGIGAAGSVGVETWAERGVGAASATAAVSPEATRARATTRRPSSSCPTAGCWRRRGSR